MRLEYKERSQSKNDELDFFQVAIWSPEFDVPTSAQMSKYNQLEDVFK